MLILEVDQYFLGPVSLIILPFVSMVLFFCGKFLLSPENVHHLQASKSEEFPKKLEKWNLG